MRIDDIKNSIRDYKDFPTKGVTFKDISPILKDPKKMEFIINEMSNFISDLNVDIIVAPDARGFIFGLPIALKLNKPFVMIRKKNKLPGSVFSESYDLEYGNNSLEIQQDSLKENQRVVIVDDVIATGGTSKAIENLIKKSKAKVVGHVYLMSILNIDFKDSLEGEFYSMIKI